MQRLIETPRMKCSGDYAEDSLLDPRQTMVNVEAWQEWFII